jgi:hypothetical protein
LVGDTDFEFAGMMEIDIRFMHQPCYNYFEIQASFDPRPFTKLFSMGCTT